MLVCSGAGSSVSTMVRVNVGAHGHGVFDVDCGSCRWLNPDPTRRPRGCAVGTWRRCRSGMATGAGCESCGEL